MEHRLDIRDDERGPLISSFKEVSADQLPEYCIYKTPTRLWEQNKQAYTPKIVSIGPFHYCKKEEYRYMEDEKQRYLQKFLEWTHMSLESAKEFIKVRETRIRNSYVRRIELESDELVNMVLRDVVFGFAIICGGPVGLRLPNDELFGGLSTLEDIITDMLLLENQLPFFLYVDLFQLVPREENANDSIFDHCYASFRLFIPKSGGGGGSSTNPETSMHIIDFIRQCHLPSEELEPRVYNHELKLPTVTQLHMAGVKFKASGRNLVDLKFDKRLGILEIPVLVVDFRTEVLFRNMLAFEQCHCKHRYITEYVYFMDSFIDTPKDVEILTQSKIIVNSLGDNEAVAQLFNNLGKGLTSNSNNFYYEAIFEDMVEYCDYPWHKWMATLRHEYLTNPWKILSIVAASILLVLTFIQTVSSVISIP